MMGIKPLSSLLRVEDLESLDGVEWPLWILVRSRQTTLPFGRFSMYVGFLYGSLLSLLFLFIGPIWEREREVMERKRTIGLDKVWVDWMLALCTSLSGETLNVVLLSASSLVRASFILDSEFIERVLVSRSSGTQQEVPSTRDLYPLSRTFHCNQCKTVHQKRRVYIVSY